MMYITRKEHFSSAHRLFIKGYNNEQNHTVFGDCSNPNWHGHNYELFVTVKGDVDPITGFVINLSDLGVIVKNEVIKKVDHKNLNLEVSFLEGVNPTCENLAIAIWRILENPVSQLGAKLHCIKISETTHNFVEYYG